MNVAGAERPLLLGHRGARRTAPENTIAAFDLCLDHGCDGFEFDLRLCADAQLVTCHDARLAGLRVAGATYPALTERAQAKLGCALARLQDVLAKFHARAFLDIELKVPGMEETVVAALRACGPGRGYVVSSFLPQVLERMHALDENIPLGFIFDQQRTAAGWRQLQVSYVIPKRTLATADLITEAHAAGKQVLVWTVNHQHEMLRLAEAGVDGIISDNTALLCHTFRRAGV
jgi:glycerophosphoryl diester phosphodiesterase